jgi:hypothetical protein
MAILLWFHDEDPVSTHTLAFAAHEIIHVISKKRNPQREDLIFDARMIKEEYRAEVNMALKKHANFFKHAKRDTDGAIEFHPSLPQIFMTFSIIGIRECGEVLTDEESAFWIWMQLNSPGFLTPEGHKLLAERAEVADIDIMRRTPKDKFLKHILKALATLRAQGWRGYGHAPDPGEERL